MSAAGGPRTLLVMRKRVIDNRFELVERLGGGGMGLVWRAWDLALHRDVALKEVRPPDPLQDEHDPAGARELRARVLREARALARLNHPHVVTIHHIVDAGESEFPWIVMELVSGGSLQDRLAQGPMTPAETARLGREILSALRAAHAVGIQHRDVKPANVLLRPDGRSVLTDFGIAAVRESTSLTATGSFIGSPEFMAPERINGHEGNPASDFWSLGMLLYVAVEGRHPLRRATTLATLAAVLNQEIPTAERAGPLDPVLGALLRRDPAARPDGETLDRMLASVGTAGTAPPARPVQGPPPHHMARPAPGPTGPGMAGPPTGPGMAGPVSGPTGPGMAGPAAKQDWAAPYSQQMTTPSRRPRSAARTGVLAVSVAAVAVVGVLAWTLLPLRDGGAVDDPRSPSTRVAAGPDVTSSPPDIDSTTDEEPDPGPENLLTPAGVRAMIGRLKPVIGGTKVYRTTIYPTYASITAPVKGEKGVFDTFSYRDRVAKRDGAGGPTTNTAIDLAKFDWDRLPALIRTAEKTLGVKKPTTRYLIVDSDATFSGTSQALWVYVSDEYRRSGYLVADVNGKVVRRTPAS